MDTKAVFFPIIVEYFTFHIFFMFAFNLPSREVKASCALLYSLKPISSYSQLSAASK